MSHDGSEITAAPLAIALRAIPLLCKRHHVSSSCIRCTQAARAIHGKQLQALTKRVNTLVPTAKFAALRGISLVQDEREILAHAAGAHS